MNLNDLFKKDYGRTIETVIKADDKSHILQEVEEYVITNEISHKLADFFEQYNNYEGANGVWISGFFGSGKSHLLKILSYVLEDRTVDGVHLGELFAEKVTEDAKLKGDIKAGTRIPSESILWSSLWSLFHCGRSTGHQNLMSTRYRFYRTSGSKGNKRYTWFDSFNE